MATKGKKAAPKKPAPKAVKKPAPKPAKKAVGARAKPAAAAAPAVDEGLTRELEAARAEIGRLEAALEAARAAAERMRRDDEQAARETHERQKELDGLRAETMKNSIDLSSAKRRADEAATRANEAATRASEATARASDAERRAGEAQRRAEAAERERARLAHELDAARAELGSYKLRCPKCGKSFVEEQFEGITIDRCTGCDAIYFDAGEVDQLLATVQERLTAPATDPQQASGWFRNLFKRKPKAPAPGGDSSSSPPVES